MSNITNLPTSTYFKLEQLEEGIFVAIYEKGQGAWSNAGIIDLGDEVLIVDTFLTPNAARELRKVAEEITGKDIRFVFNTHSHLENMLGNQVFEDTTIISTIKAAEEMQAGLDFSKVDETSTIMTKHITQLANNLREERDAAVADSRLWEVREYQKLLEAIPEIKLTLPSVTFESKHAVKGTKRNGELYTYGGGHSKSDAFLYLRADKILFAGDLVFVENHPSIHTQTPEEWIAILDKMKAFEIEKVVVGHGPVGTKDDIDSMIRYLMHLNEVVQQGETKSQAMPEAFKSWGMLQVYKENLEKLNNQKERYSKNNR